MGWTNWTNKLTAREYERTAARFSKIAKSHQQNRRAVCADYWRGQARHARDVAKRLRAGLVR